MGWAAEIDLVISAVEVERAIPFTSSASGPGSGGADLTGAGGVLGAGGTNRESAMVGIATPVGNLGTLAVIHFPPTDRPPAVIIKGDLGRSAGIVVYFDVIDESGQKAAFLDNWTGANIVSLDTNK